MSNRTERDEELNPPETFKAPNESLQSRAKGGSHIFIYSTSLQTELMFDDADACVEIFDPVKFVVRLRLDVGKPPKCQGRDANFMTS